MSLSAFAKDVMPDFLTPNVFVMIRIIGAFSLFFLLRFLFFYENIHKSDYFHFFLCGLFGVAINMLLFFNGLNQTAPINASIIMITTPLIVYFNVVFFKIEKFKKIKLFGVLIGLIGGIYLVFNTGYKTDFKVLQGDIFIFLNAISYSWYLIIVKPLMKKYNPVSVLYMVFSIGFLLVFPFGIFSVKDINWSIMPINIYFKIGFVIFFTTFLAYFFNIYGLKKLKSSTVALYIYIQPLLTTIIAIMFNRDVFSFEKAIAADTSVGLRL